MPVAVRVFSGIAVPFGLGALVAILLHKEQSGKVSQ